MSPVTPTSTPSLKKQYPHVDNVEDWRAQQSLRLLWDRVFALEGRLQATEATVGDLVTAQNVLEDRVAVVNQKAQDALAVAQLTAGEQSRVDQAEGDSTIPDYLAMVEDALAAFDPVVPIADEDAAKAQLTRAAAWAIWQVDPNIGLLEKTYGTQVNDRSIDVIVQMTDGSFADCASSSDNGDGTKTIVATWGTHAPDSNTSDESRWIIPTATIAAESGPMGPA
jgi:hypothetical protein